METLLTELRTKGFDKYQEEIRKKMNLKKELETSISTLQNELIMYNNKKRYWLKENGKVVQKIQTIPFALITLKQCPHQTAKFVCKNHQRIYLYQLMFILNLLLKNLQIKKEKK